MIARKFAAVFAAIAMLSCAVSAQLVTASAASEGLIGNGDAETTYYWGNGTQSTEQVHSGTYSYKKNTDADGVRYYIQNHPTAGETYQITAWIYTDTTATFNVKLRDNYTTLYGAEGECTAGKWTMVTDTVTVSAWNNNGDLKIWTTDSSVNFYVDDLSVVLVEASEDVTVDSTTDLVQGDGNVENTWYWGNGTQSSEQAYGGTYSYKITSRSTVDDGSRYYIKQPTAGATYQITAWVYPTETDVFYVRLRSGYYSDGGTATAACKANTWTKISAVVTVPDNWSKGDLVIRSTYSTADFYIDDLSVAQVVESKGFAFAEDQSFTSEELSKKAIKVVSTDGTATIALSDSNVSLPDASGEGSITIAGIVISNIPAGKSISSVSIVDVD